MSLHISCIPVFPELYSQCKLYVFIDISTFKIYYRLAGEIILSRRTIKRVENIRRLYIQSNLSTTVSHGELQKVAFVDRWQLFWKIYTIQS